MVIKGQSGAGARRLAVHLMRTDTNERAEVMELRGVAAEDLQGALSEIDAVATGTRCQKPFYHASINTRADERMSDAQRMQAIDRLEQELGLVGQPRAVVLHEKEGREHCHIVWSRIDLERMAAISDSHNYRKHEIVARDLEREFGHQRVQGAHIEREGQPRPARTPSHDEMQQAERGAARPQDAKAQLTGIWQRTATGQEFRAELEQAGWLLARGDRRDFVAVDRSGGTHSLARRIEGAKAADIRARMADLDPAMLPSVAEAKQLQQARAGEREERGGLAEPTKEPPGASPAPEVPEAARSQAASQAERIEPVPERGPSASRGLFMAADSVAQGAEKLTDFVAGLVESLGGAPPRQYGAAELARDPGARRDYYAQQAAERASNEALDRLREDMDAGKGLSRDDVRSLTPAHRLQINAHGDDYLRQAIADREKEQERSGGRERER